MNTAFVTFAGNADLAHGPRGQGAGPAAVAWQRELGKALARGWFHGPLDPQGGGWIGPGTLKSRTRPEVLAQVSTTGLDVRSGLHAQGQELGPARQRPGIAPSPGQASGLQMASAVAGTPDIVRVVLATPDALAMRETDGELAGNVPTTPSRAAPTEHHEPVRIHVEHGEGGSTVWIGLDGDASFVSRQAHAIVAELARQFQGAPHRLATVICNGTVVYGEVSGLGSTTRREPPWR